MEGIGWNGRGRWNGKAEADARVKSEATSEDVILGNFLSSHSKICEMLSRPPYTWRTVSAEWVYAFLRYGSNFQGRIRLTGFRTEVARLTAERINWLPISVTVRTPFYWHTIRG
jgi:hypothetical protein